MRSNFEISGEIVGGNFNAKQIQKCKTALGTLGSHRNADAFLDDVDGLLSFLNKTKGSESAALERILKKARSLHDAIEKLTDPVVIHLEGFIVSALRERAMKPDTDVLAALGLNLGILTEALNIAVPKMKRKRGERGDQ